MGTFQITYISNGLLIWHITGFLNTRNDSDLGIGIKWLILGSIRMSDNAWLLNVTYTLWGSMLAFKLPAVSIGLLLVNGEYKILVSERLNIIIEKLLYKLAMKWFLENLHEHFRKEQIQNLCIGQVFRKLKPIQLWSSHDNLHIKLHSKE